MWSHSKLVVGELALFTQNIQNHDLSNKTSQNREKPWETTQYPHGHSIQGIRTKEVLVGTKFVNSKCMLGKQFWFSWHIVPRKCLQRKSSLHVTSSYAKVTKGSHLKAWVFLKSCNEPPGSSRDSRHTSKCSHIHIVKSKQATTSLYQKHPKAWEQNRCYSRYMLFLDTTRYSQLQPGSMQHPVVIPQSKSRWGGTTSCLDVSWAPLPATSGRTDRKAQISLCKTPPGLSSLSPFGLPAVSLTLPAKWAKHMSKAAPGLQQIFLADKRCPGNTCSAPTFSCDLLGGKTA